MKINGRKPINEEWVDTVARTYPIMKKSIFRLSVAVLLSAM